MPILYTLIKRVSRKSDRIIRILFLEYLSCYHYIYMPLNNDIIDALPASTGVYMMRDPGGRIIYVGKAKDIRSRVYAYLGQDSRHHVKYIRENTDKVEYILTRNEHEALLLENRLIKAYKPRYNIFLKDDKTYVSIKITTNNTWPGLYITRRVIRDGSRYFGPYSSAQATKKTLSAIGRIFPVRRCKDTVFSNRARPCIFYQIGLCLAPCVKKVSEQEYAQVVKDLISFLEGKDHALAERLRERMKIESSRMNFEKAARIRDQINAIQDTMIPQVVVGNTQADIDVFGSYRHLDKSHITVLRISKGSMADSHNFTLNDIHEQDFITDSIIQFYLQGFDIPPIIYTDTLPDDKNQVEDTLSGMRASKVRIRKARQGKPLEWVSMARDNAMSHFRGKDYSILDEIAKAFSLTSIPFRMECYDISNIQGRYATGSRAVFIDGRPEKSLYRHYRIKEKSTQDDFAMLQEVFSRRFSGDETRPDLIIIDGGKGQLNRCLSILNDLGLSYIPAVAMAKARGTKTDRFFLQGRKDPLALKSRGKPLHIMQRIRDEAHRFAIKYHRHLRSKEASSLFEEIPGIGPKKARDIQIQTAHIIDPYIITANDLQGCRSLSVKDINNILKYLKDLKTDRPRSN